MATMTRRELYDLVWSTPMRDAARQVGMSDVGLKKVCRCRPIQQFSIVYFCRHGP
jgi:hypothetical protein